MIWLTPSFQEQFLDQLLADAGFEVEDFSLLKDDLRPVLQERVIMHMYSQLDTAQVDTVWWFLNSKDYNGLNSYLKIVIPNFDEFMMEIYAQFEDEYLEDMNN
jgi:hypothetical protein